MRAPNNAHQEDIRLAGRLSQRDDRNISSTSSNFYWSEYHDVQRLQCNIILQLSDRNYMQLCNTWVGARRKMSSKVNGNCRVYESGARTPARTRMRHQHCIQLSNTGYEASKRPKVQLGDKRRREFVMSAPRQAKYSK